MPERIIKIDPDNPQKHLIDEAVRVISSGGVIVFPTRSLYGLGADALNPEAAEKIFKIKKRARDKPILVLIKNRDILEDIVLSISESTERIMDAFWPGNVTIVLEANPKIPKALTAGTGKIGVRFPGHPVAAALAEASSGPLTGTSANISGERGCNRIADLNVEIASSVDLIVDAGPLTAGKGSTVVDGTICPPKVLREGAIAAKEIQVLFRLS